MLRIANRAASRYQPNLDPLEIELVGKSSCTDVGIERLIGHTSPEPLTDGVKSECEKVIMFDRPTNNPGEHEPIERMTLTHRDERWVSKLYLCVLVQGNTSAGEQLIATSGCLPIAS